MVEIHHLLPGTHGAVRAAQAAREEYGVGVVTTAREGKSCRMYIRGCGEDGKGQIAC